MSERKGKLELTELHFRHDAHVLHVAQRIASSIGRSIDESNPMLDARLADGSRVNVVIPPLSLQAARASRSASSPEAHDGLSPGSSAAGTLSAPMARALEIAARCRLNIIVSGGTGSGKTTLLNALSSMIDRDERIVTIEDAAELQLQQDHVVQLETRPPNIEGPGQVDQRALVRNALRMRPDRIIVGEVRGAEAFDMMQAMNTGHDGSMSTVHANSARDALARIENMMLMANVNLPTRAIRGQIASARRSDRAHRAHARRRAPGDGNRRGGWHGRGRDHARHAVHVPLCGRESRWQPQGRVRARRQAARAF